MWWRNSYQRLKEVDCPNQMPQLMKFVGLAGSTTQAAKLLKSSAVEMRPWDLSEWWTKVTLTTKLPEGVPVMLRVGKAVYGLETVMFPSEGQTYPFWKHFLEDEEEPYYHATGVTPHGREWVGFTRSHECGLKIFKDVRPDLWMMWFAIFASVLNSIGLIFVWARLRYLLKRDKSFRRMQ